MSQRGALPAGAAELKAAQAAAVATTISTPAILRALADESITSGTASLTFAEAGKTIARPAMLALRPTAALPLAAQL